VSADAADRARPRRIEWRRVGRGLLLAAALLPPIAVAAEMVRHASGIPHHDQWAFARLVLRSDAGTLAWSDLWLLNNEHRVVVPYVVLLGLARLTAWNLNAELALSFAVALVCFALLVDLLRETVGRHSPGAVAGLVLLTSLAMFSMVQQETWGSGWQITVTLNVLAAVTAAWALVRYDATARGTSIAMLAAIIGAFSFASGLLLLGLVPLALVVSPSPRPLRARARLAAAAALVGAVTAKLYYVGYYSPINHAPVSPLAVPLRFAGFALAYVGATLGAGSVSEAQAWGGLGLLVLAGATLWLWPRSHDQRQALLPWLFLATYTVLAGASTAIGRLSNGPRTPLLSRYTTISALFWPSVAAAAVLVLAQLRAQGRRWSWLFGTVVAGLVLLVAAPGYIGGYAQGAVVYAVRADQYELAGRCMRNPETATDDCLRLVCWDPKFARTIAQQLAARRIGPYARWPATPAS
jgi:hypothetical protein